MWIVYNVIAVSLGTALIPTFMTFRGVRGTGEELD
jgi:hypothetical protein